jgi:hypothetical protein
VSVPENLDQGGSLFSANVPDAVVFRGFIEDRQFFWYGGEARSKRSIRTISSRSSAGRRKLLAFLEWSKKGKKLKGIAGSHRCPYPTVSFFGGFRTLRVSGGHFAGLKTCLLRS